MRQKQRWHLVADMRSILLKCWGPFAGLTIIVVVLQIILGRYEGEIGKSICWLFLCIGPGSALLLSSSWLNKNPQKLIGPDAFRALIVITILHGFLSLFSLLMLPFAVGSLSAGAYLFRSLSWLSLSNTFLIGGYSLLFFKKENKIKPNPEIIRNIALAEREKATKKGSSTRELCFDLIAHGDVRGALRVLKEQVQHDDEKINQIILLESRFSAIENQIITGTVDENTAQIEINRISLALLNSNKLIR